ncbi:MAG: DUF5685 family protein [[Clostridium] scindens]
MLRGPIILPITPLPSTLSPTYYKCKDDWDDERSRKGYMAARMLKPKVEAIRGRYPEKVAGIASNLSSAFRLWSRKMSRIST